MQPKRTTKTQGTREIGEKTDVLEPGGRMVSIPTSIGTRLISSTMFKPISTTAADVPFESYGCGLKIWWPNSQGKAQFTGEEVQQQYSMVLRAHV